jgi:hypothetical protein
MSVLLLHPKNIEEQELLLALAKKMSIGVKLLSDEELEDFSLALMIKDSKDTRPVSRASVMKALRK